MFAVINHLHFKVTVDELQPAIEQEGITILSGLPGFKAFHFVRVTEARAIVILFWESAEAADNGAKTFGPTWFAKHIAPYLASEQQRSGGEVIVSHVKAE